MPQKIDTRPEEIYCTCLSLKNRAWYPQNKKGGRHTWWLCSQCHKPSRWTLNQCDTCNRTFKGIPGVKFAFTCPTCEE